MNITFVSVKERTKEIGTRKALGARRRTILLQFLIESTALCLLGGMIGLSFAFAMCYLIGVAFPSFPIQFSTGLVAISMVVSVLTGLISGFAPAWTASRLDPVTALAMNSGVMESWSSAAMFVATILHHSTTPTHESMRFKDIIAMALSSLGANKLRAALTMIGITIGVFSIILVMTAIGALQSSIESGISFLGSNVFQFAKYPVNIDAGGANVKKKYQNRRNISYQQAQRYYELMQGNASEICLKCFGRDLKGQAVYNGVKTPPSLTVVGTNRGFLTANAFTLGYGRNLNEEDVALARNVAVIGKGIEKRLFPHESPIGKVIRMSGHTYSVVGVLAEKGTSFGKARTISFSCRSPGFLRITAQPTGR